jgi:aminopeptidase N
VTATLPADIQFAHSGEITQRAQLQDGQVRYDMHAENVRDFAMALSRAYEVDSMTSASGVLIELYTVDTGSATKTSVLAWAADAVDRLSDLIGPYPYASYRIADAGPSMPGGVEFPGMIYINTAYPELDRLIYHETAHQWLYGIIGNRTLQDGWIDEGGAEFFERGLATDFTEIPIPPDGGYRYPADATAAEMQGDTSRQPYYSIYEQGARLWYAVLDAMGPDDFWSAMHDLYDQHRFGIVTAWDVLSTWQRHSVNDLRPLFHDAFRYDWIDQLPLPGAE